MIKSVFERMFKRKSRKSPKENDVKVNTFREQKTNITVEYNNVNSCENKEVNISFNGNTKFDVEDNSFKCPNREYNSKIIYLKTQESRREYIEDQLSTLLINLKLISENIVDEHAESCNIKDLISIIINQSSTKLLLTKEKSNILAKILLSKQVELEIQRTLNTR